MMITTMTMITTITTITVTTRITMMARIVPHQKVGLGLTSYTAPFPQPSDT